MVTFRKLVELDREGLLKLDSETDILRSQENINRILGRYVFRYSGIIKKSQFHRISEIEYTEGLIAKRPLRFLDFYTEDDFGRYHIGTVAFTKSETSEVSVSLLKAYNGKTFAVEKIKDFIDAYI